jgi:hypothetical protein
VDDNLARKVVAVLFNLSENDPNTVKAVGIKGFSIPACRGRPETGANQLF